MNPLAAMIVCLGIAVLGLLASLGEHQFADQERLPVHWGRRGNPNSYAPRPLALAIIPVIGILTLAGLAWAGEPVYVLTVVLLGFAAGNLVYFRAARRTLQEK